MGSIFLSKFKAMAGFWSRLSTYVRMYIADESRRFK